MQKHLIIILYSVFIFFLLSFLAFKFGEMSSVACKCVESTHNTLSASGVSACCIQITPYWASSARFYDRWSVRRASSFGRRARSRYGAHHSQIIMVYWVRWEFSRTAHLCMALVSLAGAPRSKRRRAIISCITSHSHADHNLTSVNKYSRPKTPETKSSALFPRSMMMQYLTAFFF